ncbi:uncharacterized protein LOC141902855 isoform X2 [Tubulanus polymorphus]|uniref:uncharacterized protein LOC141902855 isoform X2 n=1 Tax=Tubulanus polymorphus TaxID=672921 RepID=UPI003DA20227
MFIVYYAMIIFGCLIIHSHCQESTGTLCPTVLTIDKGVWYNGVCYYFLDPAKENRKTCPRDTELVNIWDESINTVLAKEASTREWHLFQIGLSYSKTQWRWISDNLPLRNQGCFSTKYFEPLRSAASSTDMSAALCIAECKRQGSTNSHAGIKNGNECFCSANWMPTEPQNTCIVSCPGDQLQFCGGIDSVNVYSIRATDKLPEDVWPSGYPDETNGFLGCGALQHNATEDKYTMSVERCISPKQFICMSESSSWFEARMICKSQGGHLMEIRDMSAYRTVSRLLKNADGRFWTGLTKDLWYWGDSVSLDNEAVFTAWEKDLPVLFTGPSVVSCGRVNKLPSSRKHMTWQRKTVSNSATMSTLKKICEKVIVPRTTISLSPTTVPKTSSSQMTTVSNTSSTEKSTAGYNASSIRSDVSSTPHSTERVTIDVSTEIIRSTHTASAIIGGATNEKIGPGGVTGIVIGVILLIGILVLLFVVYRRWKTNKQFKAGRLPPAASEFENLSYSSSQTTHIKKIGGPVCAVNPNDGRVSAQPNRPKSASNVAVVPPTVRYRVGSENVVTLSQRNELSKISRMGNAEDPIKEHGPETNVDEGGYLVSGMAPSRDTPMPHTTRVVDEPVKKVPTQKRHSPLTAKTSVLTDRDDLGDYDFLDNLLDIPPPPDDAPPPPVRQREKIPTPSDDVVDEFNRSFNQNNDTEQLTLDPYCYVYSAYPVPDPRGATVNLQPTELNSGPQTESTYETLQN